MATLHLMVGLPCSGKTTRARALAEEFNALVLTPDVWQLKLFGDDVGDPAHDARHTAIEQIMWSVAERVLAMGGDVVLDFGFWAREEMEKYVSLFEPPHPDERDEEAPAPSKLAK